MELRRRSLQWRELGLRRFRCRADDKNGSPRKLGNSSQICELNSIQIYKYVPLAAYKLLENMPMPWEKFRKVEVLSDSDGAISLVMSVPWVVPPIYIAQWAATLVTILRNRVELMLENQASKETFSVDNRQQHAVYSPHCLPSANHLDTIQMDLTRADFETLNDWFYDPALAARFLFKKGWIIPEPIMAVLYELSSIFYSPKKSIFKFDIHSVLADETPHCTNGDIVAFPHLYDGKRKLVDVYYPPYDMHENFGDWNYDIHPDDDGVIAFCHHSRLNPVDTKTVRRKEDDADDFCLPEGVEPFLKSTPLFTENTASSLSILSAPHPFNMRSGRLRRAEDIPLVSDWYRMKCRDCDESVKGCASLRRLRKHAVLNMLRRRPHKSRKRKNLFRSLAGTKYFHSTKVDWVEAGLKLCKQGRTMLNLLLQRHNLERIHVNHNFRLNVAVTITTKELKFEKKNAFHLCCGILQLMKLVLDAHVKFRLGNVNAFQLADALQSIFSHVGQLTGMSRYSSKVSQQIRLCEDLKHLNYQHFKHLIPMKGPGIGFWAPMWRVWLFFIRGMIPYLEHWLGKQFGQDHSEEVAQLYAETMAISSENYEEILGNDGPIWLLDIDLTNGDSIFILNVKDGRLLLKVGVSSILEGHERLGQLLVSLFQSHIIEEPGQIFVTDRRVFDCLPVQFVDFPLIFVGPSELQIPLKAILKLEKFNDMMYKATSEMVICNIYDDWVQEISSLDAFKRITLSLCALHLNNDLAKRLLMPGMISVATHQTWPSFTKDQWRNVEIDLKRLILCYNAKKNNVDSYVLKENHMWDIIFGSEIEIQDLTSKDDILFTSHLPATADSLAQAFEAILPSDAITILYWILDDPSSLPDALGIKEQAIPIISDLLRQESRAEELKCLITQLRPFFSLISKAKTAKIIRVIVDAVAKIPGTSDLQIALCKEVVQWTLDEKRTFLRHRIEVRLAELLVEKKDYFEALSLLSRLSKEVGRLDDKSLLVVIDLLKSKLHFALHDLQKAKASLTAARTAADAISVPPAQQGSIDLQSGVLLAEERDYKTAYGYFHEAFETFNALRDPLAIRSLKYILLCKILADQANDVKVMILSPKVGLQYQGPELDAMRAVADAYCKRSLKLFEISLQKFRPQLEEDPIICRHLSSLFDTLLEQNLCRLIEPFSRVEIGHIADLIELPANHVEKKVCKMILDKKLSGTLDDSGCIINLDDQKMDELFPATVEAIKVMGKIVDSLFVRASRILE